MMPGLFPWSTVVYDVAFTRYVDLLSTVSISSMQQPICRHEASRCQQVKPVSFVV